MDSGFKIAIGGKGGVGKTTVSAVLAQLLARDGYEVMAVDADSDANLCQAMGVPAEKMPESLIHMTKLIAERTGTDKGGVGAYFKLNPDVSDLPDKYCYHVGNLRILSLGSISNAGAGCACSEGAFLKAMLSHTILHRKEIVVVDLDAGVECMGRASVLGVDALVTVVEPGIRSIDTAIHISEMARQLGILQRAVIINKVTDSSQVEQIKSRLGDIPVLTSLEYNTDMQKADLEQMNVIDSSKVLVDKISEAKTKLLELIGEDD